MTQVNISSNYGKCLNFCLSSIFVLFDGLLICSGGEDQQHNNTEVFMICIWYPFSCDMGLDGTLTSHIERVEPDMGLDGTLTSHIERVEDEFDMACQSAI